MVRSSFAQKYCLVSWFARGFWVLQKWALVALAGYFVFSCHLSLGKSWSVLVCSICGVCEEVSLVDFVTIVSSGDGASLSSGLFDAIVGVGLVVYRGKHLMGMAMYLNDSFNAIPTVQMLVVKDKPELWQVCTVKAGDQATMEYGGPYWQLLSSRLTKEDLEKLQAAYPHIPFPPVWPHPPSEELGTLNYKDIERAEWDYAVASKNLYDVLDDVKVPSGQVNPRTVESDDTPVVAHQEHPRLNSRPEQRLVQQSLTYHRGIHVRLQGWQEGHATGTDSCGHKSYGRTCGG
jgi:hypothetical protein